MNLTKNTISSARYFIFLTCLLVLPFGCLGPVKYNPGIYTRVVTGNITVEKPSAQGKSFVLIQNYHRTFLETSKGYLYRVTASIAYPDEKGSYSVAFDTNTVQLDLTFYADGCVTNANRFHRTLGIGKYEYNVELKEDTTWRNNYYLFIKPTLMEYITEERYLMTQRDKLFIGDWLSKVENEF